jgi:hypothetical protein
MHELAHEISSRKFSSWGGIKFFHKTYTTSGIRSYLEKLDLLEPGSNRGYDPIDLVEGFITSLVLGARPLEHMGMMRTDQVNREIFGWKKGMASASTFSRVFDKFDVDLNDQIFPRLMKFVLDQVPNPRMTLDIDCTVITRYGNQECAVRGYNPDEKGRVSHHPLLAFCDEHKMMVNVWMRSGDSHSATDALRFLEEVFQIVSTGDVGLLRGDAGFYGDEIMSYLESLEKPVPYIFRAKMTGALTSRIIAVRRWLHIDSVVRGGAYAEIKYRGSKWKKERRMILVQIPKRKDEVRHKEIFKEYEQLGAYDFMAFVTSSENSAVEIHRRYNQYGDSENRIKELKYDYGIDGFALKRFGAMEAAFRFIIVAYDIMAIFMQAIMTSRVHHRLSTIKFQCIAIGSYLVQSGRKKRMKLSAEGKRRHFLEHLFDNLEHLRPPYQFSNA